jgi:RNA polymerase sigma-70 factor (ECF subfamily)
MDDPSDEDLMLRVARGDGLAFGMLVPRHAAQAIGLARRITGSDADAEDIVQDAFLRVWVNAPRWRARAAFRTWFYRIVVNLCLNRRRRVPFAALVEAGDPPDPSPDAAARMEREEADRLVTAAVAELPERQRLVIMLTYQENLSNADAAVILDTSVSGVEALLVRARRALRDRLRSVVDNNG